MRLASFTYFDRKLVLTIGSTSEVQRTYRHHLETLSLTLHPFGIADSLPQTSAQVEHRLCTTVEAIEALACRHHLPARHDAMKKIRSQLPGLAALVDFWWQGVRQDLEPFVLGRVCKLGGGLYIFGMNRHDLTNTQWERLHSLLPPQKPHTGRPAADHRRILNGILWILRTGAPWRDLPERYGAWQTIASRFYRWRKAGIWARLFAAVQQQADAAEHLDWDIHYVDGTIVRAHQHAAGAHTRSPEAEALGRSQGGFSTKVHIRAEGGGKLMTLVLTPGQRHEAMAFEALMAGGAVKRAGCGRPKHRPRRLVGDKAYSSGKIRHYLRRHGIRITIPRKQNEHRTGPFDRAIYRLRERVERLINRLKQHRRLATRYEKCAVNYHAMWLIAATLLWL